MLGDVELAEGHYGGAARHYLQAHEVRAGMQSATISLGELLVQAGLDEDAYRLGFAQNSGIVAALAGHRGIALRRVQRNLAKYGDQPMPNLIASEVHLYLGERSAAQRFFSRAWILAGQQTGRNPFSAFDFRNVAWYAALLQKGGQNRRGRQIGRGTAGRGEQAAPSAGRGRCPSGWRPRSAISVAF